MSEIERLWALARYACERDRVPVDVTEAKALNERWRGMHAAKQGEALLLEPRSPGKPRRASWRRWLAVLFVGPHHQRVIAAHLGGGASLCALLNGKSIETTMGFGAQTGLPMATRSGDVPQDLLFYLLRRKLFDDASLERMLYERAGLLGLSGVSGDMRVLQERTDPLAVAAIEYFVYAMAKYVGAYAAVLGGLDAFVFTAGIGENSAPVRAALCNKMAWLGVKLDEPANASGGPRISTSDSGVSVWVIPTDEELMIAQHTLALVCP